MMQKKGIDLYKDRLRKGLNAAEPHWDRAIENYKHYLARLDTGGTNENDYPFYSRMAVPVSFEAVETILPRIIGKNPEFTATAIEPDDVPAEPTAKVILDTQYDNPKLQLMGEPIYLKLYKGVKESLITGNVVYRNHWRRESRKRAVYTASFQRAGFDKEEDVMMVSSKAEEMKASDEVRYNKSFKEVSYLDDFDISHKPFFFFIPDPAFDMPGRWRYMIETDYMSFEEIADEANMFKYDKTAMENLMQEVIENKTGFTSAIGKDFLNTYNDLFSNVNMETFDTDDDKIPLLKVDKMWDPINHTVHVFVNEKHALTGDDGMANPYDVNVPPFSFAHDIPIPHSYYSRSEIDFFKKLEDGMTDIYNMRFDNLLQSMVQMYLVNPNYMVDGESFIPIPGSITDVKDVDKAIRGFRADDVTARAYDEANELYQMINRIVGTNDYVKGAEGDSVAGRSYGGMRLVQEMANARFVIKSRLFEEVALKSLGYFILEFSRQFMNKDRIIRTSGEFNVTEEKKINVAVMKALKGYLDIKVTPNSAKAIDEQVESIRLNGLADRFAAEKGPFANMPSDVYDRFLVKYFQAYGIHDAVHWVRLIREQRKNNPEATGEGTKPAMPPLPATPGPMTQQVLQGDQVANQPLPLQQLMNAAGGTPVTPTPNILTQPPFNSGL